MTRNTLASDTYLRLKNKIVTSELLPGTALYEEHIAEEFDVSRTPVREALRTLEAEGLVEIQPRRGARVAMISRQDIMDAYEAREWAEPMAAAKVALHGDDSVFAELEQIAARMPVEPRTHEEASAALQADREFHDLISEVAGNALVQSLIKDARAITQRAAYFVTPARFTKSREEHKAIVAAMRARDAETTRRLMRDHIRNARGRMIGDG